MINGLLLVVIVLLTARWYRRHDAMKEAPRGLPGIMEMIITMVEDDIIKDSIGKDYKRYSPYLLTAFFFIFINNLMGIVPFFPGGANTTGNIAVTLVLAICTFLAVNLFGNKHYWKDILWPDVPMAIKCPLPLMPLIEIVGIFTKPFSGQALREHPRRPLHDSGRGRRNLPDGRAGSGDECGYDRGCRLPGRVYGHP